MSSPLALGRLGERLAHYQPELLPAAGQSRAAVALILRPSAAGEVEILFIRRAEDPKDPWSGQMAFPGGRAAPGEAPVDTAIRETIEEVGLDLRANGRLVVQLDELGGMARGRRVPLVISPFVFLLEANTGTRTNGEVAAVHWFSSAALRDPASASHLAYEHEGQSYELPCFRFGEVVIWGLTYRMLMGFFGAAGWSLPASGDAEWRLERQIRS